MLMVHGPFQRVRHLRENTMELTRRRLLHLTAGTVTLSALSGPARAQDYPSKELRILVGFPAGGALDIAARIVAPSLSERLGQAFVVENQPGESGNLATRQVVKSPPDGYTLLLCGPVNAINTALYETLDFNFTLDTAPVASIARVPLVVEVNPAVPVRSVPEFIAYA